MVKRRVGYQLREQARKASLVYQTFVDGKLLACSARTMQLIHRASLPATLCHQQDAAQIPIPNVRWPVFHAMMTCIYTGEKMECRCLKVCQCADEAFLGAGQQLHSGPHIR